VLGAGRATWPHRGDRTAVAGLNTGTVQLTRRPREPFAAGDNPDTPHVGPIRIEATKPLQEVRLVLDDPELDFAFDLTYEARCAPVPTDRNVIERDGRVVNDYMNFFQSGLYTGWVRADGEVRSVERRAGFRDRGWGLRDHEGADSQGLLIFCGCELEHESLYVLLYEDASARRLFTNGWMIGTNGEVDLATEVSHDVRFDGISLLDGEMSARMASGRTHQLGLRVEGCAWMEALGYTDVPERLAPGADRLQLEDPEVAAAYQGLFDHACRFEVDGAEGHGFVETRLGVHARYRP